MPEKMPRFRTLLHCAGSSDLSQREESVPPEDIPGSPECGGTPGSHTWETRAPRVNGPYAGKALASPSFPILQHKQKWIHSCLSSKNFNLITEACGGGGGSGMGAGDHVLDLFFFFFFPSRLKAERKSCLLTEY